MNALLSKALPLGLLFLFLLISGLWLSRLGRPYQQILFTVHKFIALGALIFLAVNTYRLHQTLPLNGLQLLAVALAVVCFMVTILTGGLLSALPTPPTAVLRVHEVMPYLTILSSAAALYALFFGSRTLGLA